MSCEVKFIQAREKFGIGSLFKNLMSNEVYYEEYAHFADD